MCCRLQLIKWPECSLKGYSWVVWKHRPLMLFWLNTSANLELLRRWTFWRTRKIIAIAGSLTLRSLTRTRPIKWRVSRQFCYIVLNTMSRSQSYVLGLIWFHYNLILNNFYIWLLIWDTKIWNPPSMIPMVGWIFRFSFSILKLFETDWRSILLGNKRNSRLYS